MNTNTQPDLSRPGAIPAGVTPEAWAAADEAALITFRETAALVLISRERDRQRELLAKGILHHDCADPAVSFDRKLRTELEELGEVAEAIDILESAQRRGESGARERRQLRDEWVQVAAVACACVEAILEEEGAEPRAGGLGEARPTTEGAPGGSRPTTEGGLGEARPTQQPGGGL